MYPHRIQLREPWQCLPGQQMVFRRAFRWSTELMPFEELWLIIGSINVPCHVKLNQQVVTTHHQVQFPCMVPISKLVQVQNILEIICEPEAGPRAPQLNGVFLEVRRTVHLGPLHGKVEWEQMKPILHLHAPIHGVSEKPLSVAVMLHDQEVHYQELSVDAREMNLTTPPLNISLWLPGQENKLHSLDVRLLDPACILDQQHYLTGFRTLDTADAAEPFPPQERLFESAWLEQADREGRSVEVFTSDVNLARAWLWYHPSVVRVYSSV